ncbi:hypothetical protein FS150101_NMOIFPPK_00972 [Fructilactobacillus sanfranciscensis]|uniref:lipopolysaccharide assembly protein LapA domain-containing protein n=1 Tax=Fructilactobacillus sanfranciscensis TaxID=1625 RepID=UPI00384E3F06
MKKQVYVILSLLIVILIAIFVLLNMEDTAVNFGFATIKMPLILIVLVSLLLGALLIFLFSSISSFKNNRQNKANLKEIKQLQSKIEELEAKIGVKTEVKDEKQVTEENPDNENEEK